MSTVKEKELTPSGNGASSEVITKNDDNNLTHPNDTTEKGVCQEEKASRTYKTAQEKLKAERNAKGVKLSQKGKAVSGAVVTALTDFCKQNSEFAQAVMQSDKTVTQCIEHTVEKCGSSISDLEVYRKAVEFYFPGATVKMQLTVDLGDGGFSNKASEPVSLSLDSLLDF